MEGCCRDDLDLGATCQQGVLHLVADDGDARPHGLLPGGRSGRLPPHEVRHPDVASLAGGHCMVQHLAGFLDRCGSPGVHLPQVDVIGPQASQ